MYGDAKLAKPKLIKNIKQSSSVDWIPKKCKCKVFVHPEIDIIYIFHRDFNSVDLIGANHEFRRKFIYNDSFGCVVLRGEAWIKIEGLKSDILNKVFPVKVWESLAEDITGEYGNCEWERFFEKVYKNIRMEMIRNESN